MFICTFTLGKPSDVLNYCHIDWVPTLKLSKSSNDVDPFIFNEFESYRENMGEW